MTRDASSAVGRLRSAYWRGRYAMWSPRHPGAQVGYAVLVPVPADLPMLTDISLSVIAAQHAPDRVETIVVPDRRSPMIDRLVSKHQATWHGPLRRLDLRAPEQALLPRLNDPGKNHAAQLLRGIGAARAEHVIFHDADLVPLDPRLHQRVWESATLPGRTVAGLDPPWDPYFAEHGRELVATWEMCASAAWLRSSRPWRHFGHEAVVPGGRHVFDTTFWAQWRGPQSRLGRIDAAEDFVHFNYVISTYRHYQRSPAPFHDAAFRLLLLRLLVDLFGRGETYDLPSSEELLAGLRGQGPVRYEAADVNNYLLMRAKLLQLVDKAWDTPEEDLRDVLLGFDRWAERVR